MIRWLHLSDLHISDKADWNNFKNELITKIKKIGKIDLVIVTGDFHNFSDKDDFDQAKIFLQNLMEDLELDINQDLFMIPGNHDGVTNIDAKDLYIRGVKNKPLEIPKNWLEHLQGMFQDYERFVKELIPDYPEDHPAGIHSRMWRDKINFIHCNTAIAADGNEKINQLLDIDGLAKTNYAEDKPNIILAHNSCFQLDDIQQQRIKDIIRVHPICAYFCGDEHRESINFIRYDEKQNKHIPCVVSYKSAPEADDEYSNFGIIIGEWDDKVACLKGWLWKSGYGFIPDEKVTEIEIDMMGRVKHKPVPEGENRTEYSEHRETVEFEQSDKAHPMAEKNYKNCDIESFDDSTTFFDYRFAKAFPGVRGLKVFNDPEECVDRLEILLRTPLGKSTMNNPIWWFRGHCNMHIKNFKRLSKSKFLMNHDEIEVKRIIVYSASEYYKKFVYIEAYPEKTTGVYGDVNLCEIDEWKQVSGEYHEEYAIFDGHNITREEYDDGSAVIDGKVVDMMGQAEFRIRYLTPYNFIICALFNPINKSKNDANMLRLLNGILNQTSSIEDVVKFIDKLPRHEKDI